MKAWLPLQSYDSGLLNEFGNSFENRRSTIIFLINRVYVNALKEAAELMLLLKKEYDL